MSGLLGLRLFPTRPAFVLLAGEGSSGVSLTSFHFFSGTAFDGLMDAGLGLGGCEEVDLGFEALSPAGFVTLVALGAEGLVYIAALGLVTLVSLRDLGIASSSAIP
ncbi:hypothetical protein Tco_0501205, partial [Tanacetum coccineum]